MSKEEIAEHRQFLKDNKIKFFYEKSGKTQTIKSEVGDYKYIESKLPKKQLGFINRIKNHIKRTLKSKSNFWRNKNVVNNKKFKLKYSEDGKPNIAYFRWTKKLKIGTEFNDIYEIDIRSAYWTVIYRWGLLTKELYLEGKKRKKKLRLIAMGSLAKRTKMFEYNPRKETTLLKKIKFNKTTTKVWDNTCAVVGESILDVQNNLPPLDFIFFWVDGIYFKGEQNVNKVLDVFKKHGFRCKVRKIYKVKMELDRKYKTNANTIVVYENKKQFKERNKKDEKGNRKGGRPFFLSKETFSKTTNQKEKK